MQGSNTAHHEVMINVGSRERIASTIGGAALVLNGLVRPSLWHTVLAVAGAALLHRGVTGNCALYSEFGIDTARQDHQRAESRREQHRTYGYGKRGQHSLRDEVNRDSEDSFPASDPPSFTPTAALGSPGGRK